MRVVFWICCVVSFVLAKVEIVEVSPVPDEIIIQPDIIVAGENLRQEIQLLRNISWEQTEQIAKLQNELTSLKETHEREIASLIANFSEIFRSTDEEVAQLRALSENHTKKIQEQQEIIERHSTENAVLRVDLDNNTKHINENAGVLANHTTRIFLNEQSINTWSSETTINAASIEWINQTYHRLLEDPVTFHNLIVSDTLNTSTITPPSSSHDLHLSSDSVTVDDGTFVIKQKKWDGYDAAAAIVEDIVNVNFASHKGFCNLRIFITTTALSGTGGKMYQYEVTGIIGYTLDLNLITNRGSASACYGAELEIYDTYKVRIKLATCAPGSEPMLTVMSIVGHVGSSSIWYI